MATARPTPRIDPPDAHADVHADVHMPKRPRPAVSIGRVRPPKANLWPRPPGELPTHCPLCFGALVSVPGASGHARHRSARCSAQCVLTTHRYQPDEPMICGSRDAQCSARHRERFVAQWARHYALMRRVWPALTIERFVTVIACADVADLWSYRALRDDDLAAVLLVLTGFLRVPDAPAADALVPAARWVRFWFDASVREIGDLWAAGAAAPRLFRVDYREPLATPYPTGAQVHAWQRIDGMRDAWAQQADAPAAAVSPSDRAAFARFLASPPPRGGESV
ncbi:hypothetical protein [Burkholderia sp. MSMB1589WGS]|uniref:hypothetical protein n=1 Tax=Burkholderia sp. MSMB1589WGS TaxID=1636425 RepID=UPI0007BABE88|nr:hypothetical protein [Burkholderia sp. MSMB1589WGS]